ncbi:replication factor-a protein 1, partial [Moniliophthora roreri]
MHSTSSPTRRCREAADSITQVLTWDKWKCQKCMPSKVIDLDTLIETDGLNAFSKEERRLVSVTTCHHVIPFFTQ